MAWPTFTLALNSPVVGETQADPLAEMDGGVMLYTTPALEPPKLTEILTAGWAPTHGGGTAGESAYA